MHGREWLHSIHGAHKPPATLAAAASLLTAHYHDKSYGRTVPL
jgi:hypothetical protein